MIYKLMFVHDVTFYTDGRYIGLGFIQFLRVNRQIYREGIPVLYSKNQFCVAENPHPSYLSFLQKLVYTYDLQGAIFGEIRVSLLQEHCMAKEHLREIQLPRVFTGEWASVERLMTSFMPIHHHFKGLKVVRASFSITTWSKVALIVRKFATWSEELNSFDGITREVELHRIFHHSLYFNPVSKVEDLSWVISEYPAKRWKRMDRQEHVWTWKGEKRTNNLFDVI